ncbi:glycine betaine ABC transporter substrate-binding protein [Salipaludibacillus aurantiacus]|uniref:Glycine betaine/proline transport system substrate-binding protein n=1 Tax=Salipaludibacillus aurantiacus TaxID=1601833 RepID=A0A1H9TW49_9BACI|nr:glycine betaine ABC transporter substrate-binding protein [Salipaludibacillus aurantiacus]SES01261.1 glycine betaine/proline transport system substrate-binding protein [Salipaludibacillus aurantiacus]
MRNKVITFMGGMSLLFTAGCGGNSDNPAGTTGNNNGEENTAGEDSSSEPIRLGVTTWTSTEAPSEIMKQILAEAGYEVEFVYLDQPIIFEGLMNEDIDFFMDAWLPYTEEELWARYEDHLQKVTTSYEEVPLGWVVPTYVEEDSIAELKGKADNFNGNVVTIDPGAGIVSISEEVLEGYDLEDEYTLMTSSEPAMMADVEEKIRNEEPVVFTGWRPHSMFAKFDLKFLEDEEEYFKTDNVYVISYNGIEDKYPEVYNIVSEWSIEVADLEAMMLEYEEEDRPFEESAEDWIEANRDQVDAMINN